MINSEKISLLSFDCSRKYIISRKQAEVPLSVPFDPRNQVGRPLVVKDAPAAVCSHCHHKYSVVPFFAGVSELQQCFCSEGVGH